MHPSLDINKLYNIISHEQFLSMEGLGNEVPFFIHAYDIKDQKSVYEGIDHLYKRLNSNGIETLKIGLYDMTLEILREEGFMDDIFEFEQENCKEELLDQMKNLFSKESVTSYIQNKISQGEYQIIFFDQIGEVYPYLRTHDLLNWIQSIITDHPVITFFPGDYIMSPEIGFHLNLFGRFSGPYYRAFRLDEYLIRRNIND